MIAVLDYGIGNLRSAEKALQRVGADARLVTDPDEAARNLGVDLYPGAQVIKGTTSNLNMGTMHTAAADFETSDPSSSVAEFYKSKFPGANVMSSSGDHYAIVSTDKKNMLTINIEPKDGKTRIHIAKIAGKIVGSDDSDN